MLTTGACVWEWQLVSHRDGSSTLLGGDAPQDVHPHDESEEGIGDERRIRAARRQQLAARVEVAAHVAAHSHEHEARKNEP